MSVPEPRSSAVDVRKGAQIGRAEVSWWTACRAYIPHVLYTGERKPGLVKIFVLATCLSLLPRYPRSRILGAPAARGVCMQVETQSGLGLGQYDAGLLYSSKSSHFPSTMMMMEEDTKMNILHDELQASSPALDAPPNRKRKKGLDTGDGERTPHVQTPLVVAWTAGRIAGAHCAFFADVKEPRERRLRRSHEACTRCRSKVRLVRPKRVSLLTETSRSPHTVDVCRR